MKPHVSFTVVGSNDKGKIKKLKKRINKLKKITAQDFDRFEKAHLTIEAQKKTLASMQRQAEVDGHRISTLAAELTALQKVAAERKEQLAIEKLVQVEGQPHIFVIPRSTTYIVYGIPQVGVNASTGRKMTEDDTSVGNVGYGPIYATCYLADAIEKAKEFNRPPRFEGPVIKSENGNVEMYADGRMELKNGTPAAPPPEDTYVAVTTRCGQQWEGYAGQFDWYHRSTNPVVSYGFAEAPKLPTRLRPHVNNYFPKDVADTTPVEVLLSGTPVNITAHGPAGIFNWGQDNTKARRVCAYRIGEFAALPDGFTPHLGRETPKDVPPLSEVETIHHDEVTPRLTIAAGVAWGAMDNERPRAYRLKTIPLQAAISTPVGDSAEVEQAPENAAQDEQEPIADAMPTSKGFAACRAAYRQGQLIYLDTSHTLAKQPAFVGPGDVLTVKYRGDDAHHTLDADVVDWTRVCEYQLTSAVIS